MTSRRICVGEIVGAHGVRGLLRVRSFTDSPLSLFEYDPLTDEAGSRTFPLELKGTHKGNFIAALEGVSDRDVAEKLKGTKLYVSRDLLPEAEEGEYYFTDLIGLAVQDEAGAKIGNVQNVHDYGAGAFLEIHPKEGKSFMLPFKDDFVPDVQVEKGFITAVIPEGWLMEEKEPEA